MRKHTPKLIIHPVHLNAFTIFFFQNLTTMFIRNTTITT